MKLGGWRVIESGRIAEAVAAGYDSNLSENGNQSPLAVGDEVAAFQR